jgi:hypothetical protein
MYSHSACTNDKNNAEDFSFYGKSESKPRTCLWRGVGLFYFWRKRTYVHSVLFRGCFGFVICISSTIFVEKKGELTI